MIDLNQRGKSMTLKKVAAFLDLAPKGASRARIQVHVLKGNWQQGLHDMFAPDPPVSKDMTDQKAYVDAWAAGIDPPASIDANLAGFDPLPIVARGITVGKHGVAAAEIGVALAGEGVREAVRHGDGAGKLERVPECFGVAKNRHGFGVAKLRVNIHEADFASEERG